MDNYAFEKELAAQHGFSTFCGVDEAGRGPLAGPVCAAAVVLSDERIEGLDDSKKLSPKKRERLYDEITAKARAYSIQFADVDEIESTDILSATMDAMRRAIAEVKDAVSPNGALIDGNRQRDFPLPSVCVVGGDAKCASIAAASILAKVTRDRLMVELDAKYPGYGFAKHKGYGSKAHFAAIDSLGPSPIHRMSFLKKHYAKVASKRKTSGEIGEDDALAYLERLGYVPLERRARSQYGEVDLIMRDGGTVVFVEVKLRSNAKFAEAREFVDERKQLRLRRTAEMWLQEHNIESPARFDVIEVYPPRSSLEREEIIHIRDAF